MFAKAARVETITSTIVIIIIAIVVNRRGCLQPLWALLGRVCNRNGGRSSNKNNNL